MRLRLPVLFLLLAAAVAAQAPQAAIRGVVADESGAVMPGVQVTARNQDTGVASAARANQDGRYYLPYLAPGTYTVTAEQEGFQKAVLRGVTLSVNQTATIDLTMKIGQVSQEVTVEAQGVAVEKESGTIGTVIDSREIENLPLLGRNPYALIELVPGTRTSAHWNELAVDETSQAVVSINGARGNQSEFLLDGAPNSSPIRNNPVVIPSVAAVQEFKVETNGFSAEFGRSAGGVINVVTRSGTSRYRGEVYEFFRNDVFDASDFFANRAGAERPMLRYNQFGVSWGGPILRGRTFFFSNYEGVRTRQGVTFLSTVPTAAQREGDFSRTFIRTGQLITIYDPATTRPDPANPSRSLRAPFPANRIPLDRQDPVARNLTGFFPLPNTAGDPVSGVNNFVSTSAQTIRKDMVTARVDHHLSARQRVYGRYSVDATPFNRPDVYNNIASPSFGPQNFRRQSFTLDDVCTAGSSSILNARYSFSRLRNRNLPRSAGADLTKLGYPAGLAEQMAINVMPPISISGMNSRFSGGNIGTGLALGSDLMIRGAGENHTAAGTWTRVFGRQTVKTGGDLRLYRMNTFYHGDGANSFDFNAGFTQGPNPAAASPTAGYGYASFFLGLGNGGGVQIVPALALQQVYWAGFVQDDVKVTRRLTLNLGLRYDYGSPLTDRFNQLTNFDYGAPVPLNAPGIDLRGALAFVGVGGVPRGQVNPDRNNVAPRFGFAYALSPRLVLRGGAGLFYAPTTGHGANAASYGTSGFLANTTFVGSVNGFTVLRSLSNPYPDGIVQATGSRLGPATLLGQSVSYTDRNSQTPYAEQWSFAIQGELPGRMLVDATYAGSRGLHLFANRIMNQLPSTFLSLGDTLRELAPNPVYGQVRQGVLNTSTLPRARLLRPFPQFDTMTAVDANWGASEYHALQLKLQKRMAHGVHFLASFSFSKIMGNVNSGEWGGENLGYSAVQDWSNLRSEWSVSELNIARRLTLSFTWEPPFGRARAFLRRGPAAKLLGGWQIAGVATFSSGVPLGVACANNTTYSFGGGCRPDVLYNPALPAAERTAERWFDTAAFAQPAPYRFGNASRTIPGLLGDGIRNADLSLMRTLRVDEQRQVLLRMQAFNLTNSVRFAVPNHSFGNQAFGTMNAQLNRGRVLQAAVTVKF
ncbi:MAG: carboxypeptidase regulatory-like domain-containing protein [Bryobacteraceae bacterium]